MAKAGKRKKRPGKGAKCSILTRFIHPKQVNHADDKKHRSTVILIDQEEKVINRKTATCYTFRFTGQGEDSEVCCAVKSHFTVEKEGARVDLFEPPEDDDEEDFQEPRITWRKSKARDILQELIVGGTVPSNVDDNTMALEDIYYLHEEFSKYSFELFPSRLKALRENINDNYNRAAKDLALFENYRSNHAPSLYSHKGYIQWQGSRSQELLKNDLQNYLNDPLMKPFDLWMSREEYRDEFPLDAFRKKIEQEVRTAKYLRTVRERGVGYKAS